MAVATVAALLAALGGTLWLAARRFMGPSVQRLHGGGDPGLMHGKTVLITGANSGLGRATAAALLRMGARVIMGCRDRARAEEAAGQLRRDLRQAGGCEPGPDASGPGELVVKELDLASLRSVRAFCQEVLQVWARGASWRSGDERGASEGWVKRGLEPSAEPGRVRRESRACDLGMTETKSRNSYIIWKRHGSCRLEKLGGQSSVLQKC